MTGYGSASLPVEIGKGVFANLQVELRAVNSRFLELNFRMPDECRGAEAGVREMLNQHLRRGKVEFRVAWRMSPGAQTVSHNAIPMDPAKLNALRQAQEKIQEQFPNAEALRVADILRYPGVVAEYEAEEGHWKAITLQAAEEALKQLIQSRQAEGAALGRVLFTILDQMQAVVDRLLPRIPEIVLQYQAKLVARLEEALGVHANQAQIPLNADLMERIRQEVVLYAVRIDVAEELARLQTHIQSVRAALTEGGVVGKRLDFLIQELNREANTLGSKSVSEDCTHAALELKLMIEQMREQVQNLE